MNKLYCLIILLLTCRVCTGQNLVPNGDFELGPDSFSIGWLVKLQPNCSAGGPMAGPDSWTATSLSPDRVIAGQAYCNWDKDAPQSGFAFIVVADNEAGKTTLLSPLETDSLYRLTCYLQLETFRGLFTTPHHVTFRFNGGDSIDSPYISDSLNWQYFDTVFMATAASTEIEIRSSLSASGLEIDNISLVKIAATGIPSNYKAEEWLKVFPNPFTDKITITTQGNENMEVTLYDITSRKLLQQSFATSTTINTAQLAKGIYLYEVKIKNGLIKQGKIVKE